MLVIEIKRIKPLIVLLMAFLRMALLKNDRLAEILQVRIPRRF